MEKIHSSITFTCPACKETFEFDRVGEYELVICPICGTDFMTVRKGCKVMLELFEINPKALKFQSAISPMVETGILR